MSWAGAQCQFLSDGADFCLLAHINQGTSAHKVLYLQSQVIVQKPGLLIDLHCGANGSFFVFKALEGFLVAGEGVPGAAIGSVAGEVRSEDKGGSTTITVNLFRAGSQNKPSNETAIVISTGVIVTSNYFLNALHEIGICTKTLRSPDDHNTYIHFCHWLRKTHLKIL